MLLLGVFAFILLSSLDGFKFFCFDLSRLFDNFRYMPVALDASDLWHMRIALFKSFVIFERLSLCR
jgi:hypothetical protein